MHSERGFLYLVVCYLTIITSAVREMKNHGGWRVSGGPGFGKEERGGKKTNLREYETEFPTRLKNQVKARSQTKRFDAENVVLQAGNEERKKLNCHFGQYSLTGNTVTMC